MDTRGRQGQRSRLLRYRLEVKGRVSSDWARWLEAEEVTPSGNTTVLHVRVTDQAELYGRLRRIHDLNLRLLSLRQIDKDEEERNES